MRTADEILRGINCCTEGVCDGCPYLPVQSSHCIVQMLSDVKELLKACIRKECAPAERPQQ